MDERQIRRDVEDIICQNDPDSDITNQALDTMVEELTEYIIEHFTTKEES